MKQIFFKTVRTDGGSVWAIGKYCKTYKIGKRYRFPLKTPAHVFGMNKAGGCLDARWDEKWQEQEINHNKVYANRPEPIGSRVLICYGNVSRQEVPVCDVHNDWNFLRAEKKWRFVSTNFTVIGEIQPDEKETNFEKFDRSHLRNVIAVDIDGTRPTPKVKARAKVNNK